jgi:Mn-dependent DtxR family transcriptional regulator
MKLKINKRGTTVSFYTTQAIVLLLGIRGIQQKDLFEICYVHNSKVYVQLNKLSKQGYITIEENGVISTTEEGLQYWKRICSLIEFVNKL